MLNKPNQTSVSRGFTLMNADKTPFFDLRLSASICGKIFAGLVAFTLFAQQPTFRSETKLVIVNLSAKDKSGRPITNLKKEDIEILEDGVRQDISVFEL